MSSARFSAAGMVLIAALLFETAGPPVRVSQAAVRAVCPPDTAVDEGHTAELAYRAINDDGVVHSVRAFPDGDRSWVRSPAIVDPIALPPGDSVTWVVMVPDTAAPGEVRVPFRVLWETGEDSCVNVITIRAATTGIPPRPGRRLFLGSIRPHPVLRGTTAQVSVELPDDAPAQLELFDAAGRRVGPSLRVAGPGHSNVPLEGWLAKLAPGRYVLRLSHRGASRSRTLIVLP